MTPAAYRGTRVRFRVWRGGGGSPAVALADGGPGRRSAIFIDRATAMACGGHRGIDLGAYLRRALPDPDPPAAVVAAATERVGRLAARGFR
jgi:hypothetical protein